MSTSEQALVSICIPSYNAEKYIAKTLHSVLEQTYKNIEIIISDNHSTDETISIIRSFNDARIKVYSNETNLGCCGNNHKVLTYAQGKYIKLLCADDLIEPECVTKEVEILEKYESENVVMVTANKRIIDENNKQLVIRKFPGKSKIYKGAKIIRKSVLWGTNIIGEPGLPLFRKDTLDKTTGVITDDNFTYCYDFDLWCKILEHGNLYVLNDVLFCFRIVSTSLTSKISKWEQAKVFKTYVRKLAENKAYNITKIDLIISQLSIFITTIARNLAIKIILKK